MKCSRCSSEIIRIIPSLTTHFVVCLSCINLKPKYQKVLSFLSSSEDPLFAFQVAKKFNLTTRQSARILTSLSKQGFVICHPPVWVSPEWLPSSYEVLI